jgi:hypothetical protein
MAVLSGFAGDEAAQMLCSAASHSPLSGMAAMYVLMSIFHLTPWLKLMRERRRPDTRRR